MNKVLAVHEQDFQAVVQPGIGWQGLNEFLAKKGIKLFFPVRLPVPALCKRQILTFLARRLTQHQDPSSEEWQELQDPERTVRLLNNIVQRLLLILDVAQLSVMVPSAPSGFSQCRWCS